MTYEEALEYLNGLLKFGIKPGLERITALARAFGNPHRQLRVIHVAGTNGKGSTSTFIASILQEAGYKTGLYLSPYVHDVRERIQINGRMIPKEDFAELISEIRPIADDISESALGPVTEFEVKTLVAYLYMAREAVDFAVLEVGMGGRLDTTNLVEPWVAVITNVSLDHMDRLGDTVEKIAYEKAGIIKTGSVVVTAAEDEKVWRVILDKCRQQGTDCWRVLRAEDKRKSPSADVLIRYTTDGGEVSLSGNEIDVRGLKPGLGGPFQRTNAATAVAAILAMQRYEVRIPTRAIQLGIANAYIPGRLEILRDRPTVVIDGAHNPDAARQLAEAIESNFTYDKLILIIGMLNTHPSKGVLAKLVPLASKVIATQSKWMKAAPAAEIAQEARNFSDNVEIAETVPAAVNRALQLATRNDLILVTGSFYTIAEVPEV